MVSRSKDRTAKAERSAQPYGDVSSRNGSGELAQAPPRSDQCRTAKVGRGTLPVVDNIEEPIATDGAGLAACLDQVAQDILGPLRVKAMTFGLRGGWTAAHWLVLRTLVNEQQATITRLTTVLGDTERLYASSDAAIAALGRQTFEGLRRWATRLSYFQLDALKAARRGGLVGCHWRDRGGHCHWLWWGTNDAEKVFDIAQTWNAQAKR
jgi:hypothetical protein